jgi:NAD(P)-dependent dehydrogenase (short-subunit alcohol dehydrogenase family)
MNSVLITGASTGFGRHAAEAFARRGYRVFATMRDPRGRNDAARRAFERVAETERVPLEVLELDVTNADSVHRAVEHAVSAAGRLDVVINNAGIAALGVTEAFTPEQFQAIFDVNVYGVVRVNRAVLPHMRREGSGLLIHVSSAAGRVTVPALAAYCASKYALEAIADAYRYELGPLGIDSVLVEPGIFRTGIHDRMMPPADLARVAAYGAAGNYVDRVLGVFQAATAAPDAPGSEALTPILLRLAEMPVGSRPFRTVAPAPMEQLLGDYNAAADALRPTVAQIFNVAELADPSPT